MTDPSTALRRVCALTLVAAACGSPTRESPPIVPPERASIAVNPSPLALDRASVITEAGPVITWVSPATVGTPVDRFGDPLPRGAIARFGSARLNHGGAVSGVGQLGNFIVSLGDGIGHHGASTRFWDAATGSLAGSAQIEGAHFSAFDPRGRFMLVGSYDRPHLFEAKGGTVSSTALPKADGLLRDVAISRDGAKLGVLADPCVIMLYDTAPLRRSRSIACPVDVPESLALSEDASLVAVGAEHGPLFVIDTATKAIVLAHRPAKEQRGGPALVFVPGTADLIEARADQSLVRWRPREQRTLYEVKDAFEGDPEDLVISDDAGHLVIGLSAGHADLTLLDAATGKTRWEKELPGFAAYGYAVGLSAAGAVIVGTGRGAVEHFTLENGSSVIFHEGGEADMTGVAFLDEERVLALGETLLSWSVATPHAPPRMPLKDHKVQTFAVPRSKREVSFVQTTDRTLHKMRTSDFAKLGSIEELSGWLDAVSEDGRTGFATEFGAFEHLDLQAMRKAKPLPGATESRTASCVTKSFKAGRVAAVLEEKIGKPRVYVWESVTRAPTVLDMLVAGDDTLACAFASTGELVIGTQTGIYVIDRRGGSNKVVTGRYLWRIVPDPKRGRVAFADSDDKVAMLDLRTGAVSELGAHDGSVDGLAFSPSGDRLASASADDSVIVWDVRPTSEASP